MVWKKSLKYGQVEIYRDISHWILNYGCSHFGFRRYIFSTEWETEALRSHTQRALSQKCRFKALPNWPHIWHQKFLMCSTTSQWTSVDKTWMWMKDVETQALWSVIYRNSDVNFNECSVTTSSKDICSHDLPKWCYVTFFWRKRKSSHWCFLLNSLM